MAAPSYTSGGARLGAGGCHLRRRAPACGPHTRAGACPTRLGGDRSFHRDAWRRSVPSARRSGDPLRRPEGCREADLRLSPRLNLTVRSPSAAGPNRKSQAGAAHEPRVPPPSGKNGTVPGRGIGSLVDRDQVVADPNPVDTRGAVEVGEQGDGVTPCLVPPVERDVRDSVRVRPGHVLV